jgi:hypothetical protein
MNETCYHLCGLRIGGCGKEWSHLVSSQIKVLDRYLALCFLCRLRPGRKLKVQTAKQLEMKTEGS